MKFVPITELVAGFVVKRRLNRDFIKFIDEITSETSPCKSELTIVGTAEVIRVCEDAQYFENACHEDSQLMEIAELYKVEDCLNEICRKIAETGENE